MIEALILEPVWPIDVKRLSEIEGYRFTQTKTPTAEELERAEVIIGLPTFEQLSAAKNLRWVQLSMAGADAYAKKKERFPKGVTLTNLSGAFGPSISEYVLTMCLTLHKQMAIYRDRQREHRWVDEGRQETPTGKNLLILGAGDIGTCTAKRFRPFGCHIVGLCRTAREIPEFFDEIVTFEHLDKALAEADIVVGALPSTPETRKLLNSRRLALLKPSAVLINVGRGDLIDTDALTAALSEGKLYGAALDVTDPEPLPPEHPLWDLPNAVITPHITGGTFGHSTITENIFYDICQKNLERYKNKEPLLNAVDLETGYRILENRYEP